MLGKNDITELFSGSQLIECGLIQELENNLIFKFLLRVVSKDVVLKVRYKDRILVCLVFDFKINSMVATDVQTPN
jgi:hypothetical protein